ncbi:SusC/RagA family TonB-linked outer membrane protein [Dinghuibacter silviterrae]|uniref:TonB-linked SusC/RagA family outer membrane protein n=1 Tax=Dinghuibacter silviterrae TaxID=1539049 RepID=A0A4R8DMN0_9BACT|nr:TonB-dependent receptor [Dinghuibacter silviterrae]TDW99233.1 TonB-linked SusC/RagA family outer membrane protein [Dinghuibacter silviterrae]
MHLFQRYRKYAVLLVAAALFWARAVAQNNNVVLIGRVIDERTKDPLPGAVIHILGTTHQVVADNNGEFNFITGQRVPLTYEVSFTGYKTKNVDIKSYGHVDIQLEESNKALGDLLIVGYGTQRKSDLTGSVATVSKNLLTQPSSSFDNLLQGAVSGVSVTQSSGQPGSTATIRVRGGNSISFGNAPLYVIDGFIVYNDNDYVNSGATSGAAVNALSTINPSDIETVEVLKDASATAIYGSRGANGVVIITTRRGKKGTNEVNYSTYIGSQAVSKKIPLMNASQWASLINDVNVSDGVAKTYTDAQITAAGTGSDWQSSALRKALEQNHELSISGGDEKSRYLISGNYFDQEGVIVNSGFKRYAGRINYERNVSDRLKVTVNAFGSASKQTELPGSTYGSINFSNYYSTLLTTSPIVPIYNADGSFYVKSPYLTTPTNPLQDIEATTNQSNIVRTLGNFAAEYKLLKDLTLKETIGADLLYTKQNYYAPSYTSAGYASSGVASIGTVTATTWVNENTLTYDHSFRDVHFLTVLGGYTTQAEKDEEAVTNAQKFPNDLTGYNNLGYAGTPVLGTSGGHTSVLNSYLGRVSYSYRHVYNVTVSGRADGASVLGANHKWGFFPSLGLSWNASEEPFFRSLKNTVSNLKLRLTGGQTGNSAVPPYSSLAVLGASNYYFNSTLVTGTAPTQLANPNLKWETTTQYDLGVDVGFLNNRVNFVADAYYKKTTDLLLNVPLPLYTGYASELENVGSVNNKGLEFSLRTDNIRSRSFSWTSNLNFATNRNRILNLGQGVSSYFPLAPTGQVSPVIVAVGLPVGAFWGYSTQGLLTAADLAKGVPTLAGVPQRQGDTKYVDYNGDGKITTADKHYLGSAQPKYTYGFSSTFTYKGFDLSFLFQGAYGNKIFNLLQQTLERPTLSQNVSAVLVNRWSATNPNGTVARATDSPVPQVTDRYIENGSYLKLKNLSLGYTLDRSVAAKIHAKQLRVYVSAQNLWTITRYSGYDPEANFYDGDNTKAGIDYGIYPPTRTFLGGLSVTF